MQKRKKIKLLKNRLVFLKKILLKEAGLLISESKQFGLEEYIEAKKLFQRIVQKINSLELEVVELESCGSASYVFRVSKFLNAESVLSSSVEI